MSAPRTKGRLSTWQAAFVVARRDFTAILFSRSFIFFLLGPLFPVLVGGFAGGIGQRVQQSADQPVLGVAMQAADADAMVRAFDTLAPRVGEALPDVTILKRLKPGESFDAQAALAAKQAHATAIVTGSPSAPVLTGTAERIRDWQGPVSMLAAQALGRAPKAYPPVVLAGIASSAAQERHNQVMTAQAGQLLLFLLTMLLAGMVLSNLVEEKGNKIIEILAAAIPMDAVFLGKLFAMLAVSFVGIGVWAGAYGGFALFAGKAMPALPEPAVGWPLFVGLGIAYFAMAYLLIGSLFLAIGSMASTVREVQTLSMPASFAQIVFFMLAAYAVAAPGSAYDWIAMIVPFSSPYAMLAHAAQSPALLPHVAAFAWQAVCVVVLIRGGARLFRSRVMKSGSGGKSPRRGLFARIRTRTA